MTRAAGIATAALTALALVVMAARLLSERGTAIAKVEVGGGDAGGLPRAQLRDERFDEAAIERALHDPIVDGLQALVIMRDDHVVLERYGHGIAADTIIDSGRFAAALLGLAAGVASDEGVLSAQSLRNPDPEVLRAAIEEGTHLRYEVYLSRRVWSRLNAAPAWIALPAKGAAAPADCCFHARVLDWLRVASVLLGDGRFEGTQVLPSGWIPRMVRIPPPRAGAGAVGDSAAPFGVEPAASAHGAEPFAADGILFLRGPARWRLWLVPGLHLAVLFGAAAPRAAVSSAADAEWDETRLPNLVIRALSDRPQQPSDLTDLQRLVPGH